MKFFFGKRAQKLLSFLAILWVSLYTTLLLVGTSVTYAQAAPSLTDPTSKSNSSKRNFDPKDTSRAIEYLQSTEKKLAPLAKPTAAPSPTPVQTGYLVQPILFIAQDMQADSANVPAMNDSFQLLKRWYSGSLEQNGSGYAFSVANAIVYRAPQPFSYYKCPNHETTCDTYDGIWGNVQTELMNAGYPLWSAGTSHVILVKGAGGWAGANCVPNCGTNWPGPGPASAAGVAILGDWNLDGISGIVNQECFAQMGTACYQDAARGALGHELGHTFGLAHAMDQQGSIMYAWWLFPNVSLMDTVGNDEKSVLRGSSFFAPVACSNDVLVTQVSQPQSVKTGSTFSAQFGVVNYGYCHWTASKADLHIVKDDVWGTKLQKVSTDIYPAQAYTFQVSLTAPIIRAKNLPTIKQSIWQMRANTTYFGPLMGGPITITL